MSIERDTGRPRYNHLSLIDSNETSKNFNWAIFFSPFSLSFDSSLRFICFHLRIFARHFHFIFMLTIRTAVAKAPAATIAAAAVYVSIRELRLNKFQLKQNHLQPLFTHRNCAYYGIFFLRRIKRELI